MRIFIQGILERNETLSSTSRSHLAYLALEIRLPSLMNNMLICATIEHKEEKLHTASTYLSKRGFYDTYMPT
jgi:hypothetical protein